jgi:hypothetical protein
MLGDARVPYSADRTVVIDGRTFTGKVYSIPGRQRHEQEIEGMPQVIILRGDQAKGYLVIPSVHSYVEFGFAPAATELSDPSLRGTPVGQETVGGLKTTKYRVEHDARDGTLVDGYLWLTAQGIPMRADGTYTPRRGKPVSFHMELSNVRQGAQNADLFELPQGLMKLPTNALQPLLGVGRVGQR